MNFQEIKDLLILHYDSVGDFADDCWKGGEVSGVGKFIVVEKYGGEGQGEEWYNTRHFVDHDIYIQVSGYYTSYDGVSISEGWDALCEVHPKEKTIIVYEIGTK